MGGGLKQEWGVDQPADAGSDAQSQDFKAAFEKEIGGIGEHLQTTAAIAEPARRDQLVARRDALYPAFQSALGQIDPADTNKAQGAIDQVLGDARSLNGEVGKFRAEAEEAYNNWQSRQPMLDEGVQQVEELEAWGDAKAATLRMLVDGVRGETDKRRYAPACATLDQLLPKLKAIYDEYLKQKQAKVEYDPAAAPLQPRLQAAAGSSFAKLAPMQQDIAAGQALMQGAADKKDFVQALSTCGDLSAKVDAYEAAKTELEQQKADYEAALSTLQPRLSGMTSSGYAKLEPMEAEISAQQSQMETAAQGEDFGAALTAANELTAKLDAYDAAKTELEQQKADYEAALSTLQPRLGGMTSSGYAKLEPMEAEISAQQGQMETAAQGEDFGAALTAANELTAKLDAYEAAKTELEQQKADYEAALSTLQPRLGSMTSSGYAKLEPMEAEISAQQSQMETAAQGEDFGAALSAANELTAKLDAYDAAKTELEQQKADYEAALSTLQPRLGGMTSSGYAKLEPMEAEISAQQSQMETAAQGEDFGAALTAANELTAKLDAYEAAKTELEQQKADYEAALSTLQPRLGGMTSSGYAKLEPMEAEISAQQSQMETAAQGEDFGAALSAANELTAKLDAYDAAKTELEQQKADYEAALAALQPRLSSMTSSGYAKLEPMEAEISAQQSQMETAAQGEDFGAALSAANELTAKLDAYEAAKTELEQQKADYEAALAALQPRLGGMTSSGYAKLEPMEAEISAQQSQMETAAQGEDFGAALSAANELTAKLDAYEAAKTELEQQKADYEAALAALQPRLGGMTSSGYAKLEPMEAEISAQQSQMETAAQGEDFGAALTAANELTAKLDAYEAAKTELEQQKADYEAALAALQPRLGGMTSSGYAKLEPMEAEISAQQSQMETAAQGEDFGAALSAANELTAKLDAYDAAKTELEQQKADYEAALAALQPRLEKALQSPDGKPTPAQKEIEALRQQMEAAAQTGDYAQALSLAHDLSAKLDALPDPAAGPSGGGGGPSGGGGGDPSGGGGGNPSSGGGGTPTLVVDEFALDSAQIPSKHRAALSSLRESLKADPAGTVRLTGHTDTTGSEGHNAKLGMARASAVRDFLMEGKAVDGARIKIDSKGESQPAAGEPPAKPDPDKGEKNPHNRRVEVFVTAGGKKGPVDDSGGDPNVIEVPETIIVGDPNEGKKLPKGGGGGPGPTKGPGPGPDTTPDGPPAPGPTKDPATPESGGGRGGGTFEIPWESGEFGKWGKTSKVKGSFKIKVKVKGEVVQTGSGGAATLGGTTNKGVVVEIELGKQKSIEILQSITIKELKETFNYELSAKKIDVSLGVKATFKTSVSWLSPMLTGKFVLAGAEWEKLAADPDSFTALGFEFGAGAQAKGSVDLDPGWVANLSVEVVFAGSIKPNWPIILAEVAKKEGLSLGARAAQTATSALTFDAVIGAGLALVAVGVAAATINELAKAVDEAQLNAQIDGARTRYNAGIGMALRGAGAPGDPWQAAGWKVGRSVFDEVTAKLKEKYPDARPDEIQEATINWLASPSHRASNVDSAEVRAKINRTIGQGFWASWVESNHGLGTSLGDAKRVLGRCFAKTSVGNNDPDLKLWQDKSSLPDWFKGL